MLSSYIYIKRDRINYRNANCDTHRTVSLVTFHKVGYFYVQGSLILQHTILSEKGMRANHKIIVYYIQILI